MEAKRLWRQKIKQYRVAIGVVGIALVVVIALIIAGYWFDWTGFNGYNQVTITRTISGTNAGTVTRTEEYQPGKGLWDWLQLLGILAIPVVVGFGAVWFTTRQGKVTDAENTDNQRETALQAYIDKMSELLLHEKLRDSAEEDEVRKIARVRTITILYQLDGRRIGLVFAFLRDVGLMSNKSDYNIVSLSGANLTEINLSDASFTQANLSGAILSLANISKSNLNDANLSSADLVAANLSSTYLMKADLSGADLMGANLSNTDLTQANLSMTNLTLAVLSGANLSGANLKDATNITTEKLEKQAKSLKGATMPDGSIHP